jgi:hypothetical protein
MSSALLTLENQDVFIMTLTSLDRHDTLSMPDEHDVNDSIVRALYPQHFMETTYSTVKIKGGILMLSGGKEDRVGKVIDRLATETITLSLGDENNYVVELINAKRGKLGKSGIILLDITARCYFPV